MEFHKVWVEQCEATRGIEDEFGTVPALEYLVGEKLMNYLEAAEQDADFRAELPAFAAEIKTIFEPWQLAEYLEKAGRTERFDASVYEEDDDPEEVEMDRQDNVRRVANELRARGQRLPGIALSGYGMAADVQKSHEAGFAAHLTKPVNFDALLATVNRITSAVPSPMAPVTARSMGEDAE